MTEILNFINEELEESGIPYEYGEWTGKVSYPYFVGTFFETDYRFEDNCTTGIFTLDGWARKSKASLIETGEKIKEIFGDLSIVRNSSAFFIRFAGTQPIPTGEAGLFKITITLYTYEWKGA